MSQPRPRSNAAVMADRPSATCNRLQTTPRPAFGLGEACQYVDGLNLPSSSSAGARMVMSKKSRAPERERNPIDVASPLDGGGVRAGTARQRCTVHLGSERQRRLDTGRQRRSGAAGDGRNAGRDRSRHQSTGTYGAHRRRTGGDLRRSGCAQGAGRTRRGGAARAALNRDARLQLFGGDRAPQRLFA